jgi:hypothetical protein
MTLIQLVGVHPQRCGEGFEVCRVRAYRAFIKRLRKMSKVKGFLTCWAFSSIVVEIIPPEHVNSRWRLNLVSLPDPSHVSTISWISPAGVIRREGSQLDNVGSIIFYWQEDTKDSRGLVVTLGRFALGGSIFPKSIRSWMSCFSLKHRSVFWPFV